MVCRYAHCKTWLFSSAILVVLSCSLAASLGASRPVKSSRTTQLFDEPYKSEDSRQFKIQASTTFVPDPKKQFDLSYADGTELKGFNGHDVVHVSAPNKCFQ